MEPDGKFLYGCGMRLIEVVRLRILNFYFDYRQILVRSGKGKKDRVVPTPEKLVIPLQKQIESASKLYQDDKELGFGSVHIPEALFRKYPNAKMELKWHYVFFQQRLYQPIFYRVSVVVTIFMKRAYRKRLKQ